MNRPRLILIEGAKGTGKTTLTNALRENLPYTQLIRLSGVADKTAMGQSKVFSVHLNALKFVHSCKDDETNFIFDRTYLSERVFCQIANKSYDFKLETYALSKAIQQLSKYYSVEWYFLIALQADFEKRLERGKADDILAKSDMYSSMRQQGLYLEESMLLKEYVEDINILNTSILDVNACVSTILAKGL